MIETKKHFNTDKWRPSALYFKKYGVYTHLYPKSSAWKEFWKEEKRRCLKGYVVDDDWITGYHYFYLNYCQIQIVIPVEGAEKSKSGKIKSERKTDFPEFWDSDYDYFHYIEEAENEGEHAVVLKARGRGYSYKGGSMLCRNYFLIPKSLSYAIAYNKEYLIKDGLLNKAWEVMDFVDNNTAWTKKRDYTTSIMHKKASYMKYINGTPNEQGYKSEIIGIAVKDDPDKIRGKRGKLILWEESGMFPDLSTLWDIARSSVEQEGFVYGLMISYGTGGSEESDYAGLEELYYNPEGYNVHGVPNIWDENSEDKLSGFFVPQYMNMKGFADADGNSDIEAAIASIDADREKILKKTNDPDALSRIIAEKPKTPQEAMQKVAGNFFPSTAIKQWIRQIESSDKLSQVGINGVMVRTNEGLKFEMDEDLQPIDNFPLKKGQDLTGCITTYWSPHRDAKGQVPDNLYYACSDPYGLTTTGGKSLGVTEIYVNENNFTKHPADTLVAIYVGRPNDQDYWNEQTFSLCEYYNAKLTPENDRGNIVDYARHHKLLQQLQHEFPILSNKGTIRNVLGRGYGVSMSDADTKLQGVIYYKDWLFRKRSKDEQGNQILTLHTIYNLYLLKQLLKFDMQGNYDAVSCALIGQYVRRENINVMINKDTKSNSMKFREMFQRK